jgi:hypothetical protein
MDSRILVKRYPYEEPYHLQLEFLVSNGGFCGNTDIYCNADDLKTIGMALKAFPKNVSDEYQYEYGSENPKDRFYRNFVLRAYITDSVGHCAVQIEINNNNSEPYEGKCKFSIQADAASINRLGDRFIRFSELEDYEFEWSPRLID